MLHGWTSAVGILVAVVAVWLWQRRAGGGAGEDDPAQLEAETSYDQRLFAGILATVALLAVALLVAGAGVDAGAWAAFVLVFVFVLLLYVGPFLGPRRPRRRRRG
jgi:hypothetical protein